MKRMHGHTVPVSNAGDRLKVTAAHVHLLVRSGHLDFVPLDGGGYEITIESIDIYRAQRSAEQPPEADS